MEVCNSLAETRVEFDTVNVSWSQNARVPDSFLQDFFLPFWVACQMVKMAYCDQLSRVTVAARLDSGPPGEHRLLFFLEIPYRNTRFVRPVTPCFTRCEHREHCVSILACGWPTSGNCTELVDFDPVTIVV